MNKQEWAALVNTLRIALADAQRERDLAQEAERRAIAERGEMRRQLREVEQREQAARVQADVDYLLAPLFPSETMKLINSGHVYRPAMGEETPDLWVQDAHVAGAERVPFVQIR